MASMKTVTAPAVNGSAKVKVLRERAKFQSEGGGVLIVTVTKNGEFTTRVMVQQPGEKRRFGMTETHETIEAARTRSSALQAEALAAGWTRKVSSSARPTFTAIPAPSPAPAKTATEKLAQKPANSAKPLGVRK